MDLSFQTESAGDAVAPGAHARGAAGLRMSGENFRHGFGTGGQKRGADIFRAGVPLGEPSCHLRLTRQTAQIDDGAGVGQVSAAIKGAISSCGRPDLAA